MATSPARAKILHDARPVGHAEHAPQHPASAAQSLKRFLKSILPMGLLAFLRNQKNPGVGWVRFGGLRRLSPVCRAFGCSRGKPVDRHYIERFLRLHQQDIRGRVLEFGDDQYTRCFGGDQVLRSDVLHADATNPHATFIGDLATADHIPDNTFDCIICTQTLHVIYDISAAIATLHRILRPGGVVLATGPGISQIARYDMEKWGDFWRFTSVAFRRLFEKSFPAECVESESYGNVLTATALMHGLVVEEFKPQELDHRDRDYEVTIGIRARKPA